MPRYIDANLVNFEDVTDTVCQDQAYEAVEAVPIADVRENVHAHWVHERLVSTDGSSYPVVRCSACQWQYPMSETRFCPNCGAEMKGADDGSLH